MKNQKTLQQSISSVWCLCENRILYKYQASRIGFFFFINFCFSSKKL